uniref:Uncharacterized protein n=1 Tax=viral metagenome TaxID=1070528 RepID=A0A6M3JYD0_9ZZZZ
MVEKEIDAKDLFKTKKGEGSENDPSPEIEIPTETEMREAATPELSPDVFEIGGKHFQYRISNIRTQKLMALALDSITDLIKKIDLAPILKNLQERMSRPRKKMLEKIAELEKAGEESANTEEIVRQIIADEEDNFMDLIEVVQDIIKYGGLSNIVETLLNLYTGVVYAICHAQESAITRDWIEDNLTMFDAQEIFFEQMQKDRIGGKVIDFLYIATRQVVNP